MASITGLRGSTGEEWYSWPVGTPESALAEVATRFAARPEALDNITASITACDKRVGEQGAALAGVWVPDALEGIVAAQWWAGVLSAPDDDTFRSARRYERAVRGRSFDGPTTVFSQSVTSGHAADDVEFVLHVETRADGDGGTWYLMARAVYFPMWAKDRAILQVLCPFTTLAEDFVENAQLLASTLLLDSSTP
ncbi:MAG: hypothetical protein LBI33_09025 [Propionibacteriaceae bacterium]|jgi:hypothetical protein|nr:hypothetical protein [Propionibacteriaceae bacterium]